MPGGVVKMGWCGVVRVVAGMWGGMLDLFSNDPARVLLVCLSESLVIHSE